MTHFLIEVSILSGFLIFCFFLSMIILFLSDNFSSFNPDSEKSSSYECGFDPYEDARNNFDIRFYLIAILFLVFDLEVAYFFPWCVSLSLQNIDGLWVIIDFFFELLLGFLYVLNVGALNWE
jgi:NADH-quinone oxidoreductase subunit A